MHKRGPKGDQTYVVDKNIESAAGAPRIPDNAKHIPVTYNTGTKHGSIFIPDLDGRKRDHQ
jgi:hypothetical protein